MQLSAEDRRRYSLRNVLLEGAKDKDTFEAEMSRRIQFASGKQPSGMFVPFEALHQQVETRAGDLSYSGGNASGAYLVENKLRETADVLRPFAATIAAGATVLTGLTSNVVIPRVATGTGPFFLAENASSYPSPSGSMTFSSLTMTPHRITDEIRISKQLLEQGQYSVSELVSRTILKDIGSLIDYAAINGAGGATPFPLGILNMTENTAGNYDYGKLSTGTTFGGATTYAKIIGMAATVLGNNVVDDGTMGWIISPPTYAKWATAPKVATFPMFLIDVDDGEQSVSGYPIYITSNLLPSNQALFGRWSDLVIGIFYVDILSDPFTYSSAGQMRIVVNVGIDVGLLHGPAIIRSEDTASA